MWVLCKSERLCFAESGVLRSANFFGRRPQDADAAKEKNHKRRGAAPPLKVLLFWNLLSLTPPRPAALPTACGVRARLLHSLPHAALPAACSLIFVAAASSVWTWAALLCWKMAPSPRELSAKLTEGVYSCTQINSSFLSPHSKFNCSLSERSECFCGCG